MRLLPLLRALVDIPRIALLRLIDRLSVRPVPLAVVDGSTTLIAEAGRHRVIEVDGSGAIVWQYGTDDVAGRSANQLNTPRDAKRLASGSTLIADAGNDRVIEVTRAGAVTWTYDDVRGPRSASRLANGHTLIADFDQHRVIEVDAAGAVAWSYGTRGTAATDANQPGLVARPRHAERLSNGHTVIADHFYRVLEVRPDGSIAWRRDDFVFINSATRLENGNTLLALEGSFQSFGAKEFSPSDDLVWYYLSTETSDAKRLPNGNTLLSIPARSQVVEVDAGGNIVWQYAAQNPWEATRVTATGSGRPDLSVRAALAGSDVGAGVFGDDGANQSVGPEVFLNPGDELRYVVRVTNVAGSGAFNITSVESATPVPSGADPNGWRVRYADAAGADITTAVTGGGWQTQVLAAGASAELSCTVRNLNRGSGETIRIVITATPAGTPSPADAVRILAQASRLL